MEKQEAEKAAKEEQKRMKEEKMETRFTKEQILKCSKYSARRDMLDALLKDGGLYSHAETQKVIEKFLKGKVD